MALGDPDAGVSLAEAVILYGGLSKRDQGSHRVTQLKLQWAKNGQPCSSPVTGDEIAGYCERQVAVERRVLDKLRSGELRATGVSVSRIIHQRRFGRYSSRPMASVRARF